MENQEMVGQEHTLLARRWNIWEMLALWYTYVGQVYDLGSNTLCCNVLHNMKPEKTAERVWHCTTV